MPTASPIGGVPASNVYGSSFQVVFPTVTFRIISPPKLKGDILSSSSARPHRTPTPVGPQTLCEEKARKSQPSTWTSIRRCGAPCAASTTMIAPCSCAQAASCSTALIVPSAFETRLLATTLTRPSFAIASSASSCSSPLPSMGIGRNFARVRFAICCHGTKFEWCSSSVATTTSPGPRLSRLRGGHGGVEVGERLTVEALLEDREVCAELVRVEPGPCDYRLGGLCGS